MLESIWTGESVHLERESWSKYAIFSRYHCKLSSGLPASGFFVLWRGRFHIKKIQIMAHNWSVRLTLSLLLKNLHPSLVFCHARLFFGIAYRPNCRRAPLKSLSADDRKLAIWHTVTCELEDELTALAVESTCVLQHVQYVWQHRGSEATVMIIISSPDTRL